MWKHPEKMYNAETESENTNITEHFPVMFIAFCVLPDLPSGIHLRRDFPIADMKELSPTEHKYEQNNLTNYHKMKETQIENVFCSVIVHIHM
jgi:hypothetical protein